MIHRAPATPELTTAFRSVACLFGSRFGSWIWTVQPLALAYACTPSDSCFIAGIDSASGEKTRVWGSFAELVPGVVLPPDAVPLDEELHAASSSPVAVASATAIEARLWRPGRLFTKGILLTD